MWSDIEAKQDYLNYLELAEVVAEIVRTPSMRPVSIGVFGTWGTGKSSLLNLIEVELCRDAKAPPIIIRFDAWLYQGFDDARAALMDVIARTLYEEAKKDAGLLGAAKRLIARVHKLRLLGMAVDVAATLHGLPTFGAAGRAVSALEDAFNGTPKESDEKSIEAGEKEAHGLSDPEKEKSPPEEIDAFRQEFRELLTKLNRVLVVFVDNLDRCLPAQTIHTLEALRLFLFMDHSAFVVAADEEMVRHSVAAHFNGTSEKHVTDYLDKLIQVPVRVPRLGVAETRAYLFMLFAEAAALHPDVLNALRMRLEENLRSSWKEDPISLDEALKIAGNPSGELNVSFVIADRMASLLSSSTAVAGNPRIVKRMLNVVRLRARIARRRNMPVDDEMVAKFALFERCVDSTAINRLYALINDAPGGKPELFAKLQAEHEDIEKFTALCPDEWKSSADFLWNWFGLKPLLTDVDLRPLVYLSKETTPLRTHSTGLSQAAALAVERLSRITTLVSPVGKTSIQAVVPAERVSVMRELTALFRQHADWVQKPDGFTGALLLAEFDAAAGALLSSFIHQIPGARPPWLAASVRDKAWFSEAK